MPKHPTIDEIARTLGITVHQLCYYVATKDTVGLLEPVYTVDEAAAWLKVSDELIRNMIHDGRLRPLDLCPQSKYRAYRIPRSELDRFKCENLSSTSERLTKVRRDIHGD
jgi:excisionase family DNA binding protein